MKKIYAFIRSALLLSGIFIQLSSFAQTTPPAQPLTYSQTFSTLAATSTILPAGLQGWNLGTSASSSFRTTIPTGNLTMIGSSSASVGTGGIHNYNGKVGILSSATNDPSICFAINTLGYRNIRVNFDAMTIRNPFDGVTNTFINGLDLQYKTGVISGIWTSVSGGVNGVYQNIAVQQITGTTPQNTMSLSLTLPAACDSQAIVFLRWVERDISGAGSRASFAIDNISICSNFSSIITISGPSAFCTAQTAFYKVAAVINGGPSPVYQWKKNGTNIGTNSFALEVPGSLVPSDQISCVMTASGACTPSSTSNIITIGTVASPPTISSAIVSDVSCAGIRNGAINITVSGGSPPYSYAWDTVNTNGSIFVASLGPKICPGNPYCGIGSLLNTTSFYIDGVDAKNLIFIRGLTYTFTVTAGHPFHVSSDSVGASSTFILNGQTGAPTTSGTVTLKTNDSNPSTVYYPCAAHTFMGYKIFLQPGYAVEDPINLVAGKYSVIVRDVNGCTATASYTVKQGTATVDAVLNGSTDASCYGAADGTIDVEPLGGTAPFSASGTGPTFTVIRETKNHSSPQFGQGSVFGYTIDGVQGKELTLMRGIKYAFSAITPGHPFFISTSDVGGNSSSEVTDGVVNSMVTNGTLFFTPNASHPNLLYYQCGFHNNMGWKINIVDQQPDGDLGNCMAGNYNIKITDVNGCSSSGSINVDIFEPAASTFYYDADGDSYGIDGETALGCSPPTGFALVAGDCADDNPDINPGMIEICDNGIDDDCDTQVDEGCSVTISSTLTVKMYIDGFYSGGGMMLVNGVGSLNNLDPSDPMYSSDPEDVDDVTVSAIDAVTFLPVESMVGRLKTNGNVTVNFTSPVTAGTSYYIRLTHRNLIQTWSKDPVLFDVITSYDFTTASTQAYDDGPLPMKEVEPGVWACYNGDIDQDEAVTSLDMTNEENASNVGGFGYYSTDLDGDGGNTSLDMTIIENNANHGIYSPHP